MSTYWLRDKLGGYNNVIVDGGDPILSVSFKGRTERVYCPDPDEYRVTADVVEKARRLDATIIAYASTWCGSTYEGSEYGRNNGVRVMPYADFFAYLKQCGVELRK